MLEEFTAYRELHRTSLAPRHRFVGRAGGDKFGMPRHDPLNRFKSFGQIGDRAVAVSQESRSNSSLEQPCGDVPAATSLALRAYLSVGDTPRDVYGLVMEADVAQVGGE